MSDKRFEQLSADYEREQTELEAENAALQAGVDAYAADSLRADRFIKIVRRHTKFEELTAGMLNEFVSRILVHEAGKSSGERIQEVEIIFNFIGKFEPPSEPPAPPAAEELAAPRFYYGELPSERRIVYKWQVIRRRITCRFLFFPRM